MYSGWISTVKSLLVCLGIEQYFDNPASIETGNFAKICAEKLQNMFAQQWRASISSVSGRRNGQANKLRFYQSFKTTFTREPYLQFIPDFFLRKKVSKFRCSDHTLEIEIGRHKGITAEERFCPFCEFEVKDELHFLTVCPIYNSIRKWFFGNHQDWLTLIKCADKNTSYSLANFLRRAFDHRSNLLALPNWYICLLELPLVNWIT